jgi:hypothetical protein
MSKYSVEIKEHALHDLNMLRKNEPKSYKYYVSPRRCHGGRTLTPHLRTSCLFEAA